MNNKFIRIICMLLCIAILFTAAGCNNTTTTKKKKKVVSGENNVVEIPGDVNYITNEIVEPGDEIIDYEYNYLYEDEEGNLIDESELIIDEEGNAKYKDAERNDMYIHNSQTPILTNFLGASGTVYHGSTLMNDAYGRNYTEEMAQLEFDRV
ncbi:MAG: hypothetical protein KBS41_05135, partial [Oscillospiraceae bacterium]|nr:hypothetical protein [Candidatus Equicaccousia limihippi]